jgi:GNAT superfamily N-acetyltransferase
VIGDGALTFYIQDLLVVPRMQRKGIGRKVMELVLGHLGSVAPPGAFIGLMAAPGTEAFFARQGFAARPADAPAMQLSAPLRAGQA